MQIDKELIKRYQNGGTVREEYTKGYQAKTKQDATTVKQPRLDNTRLLRNYLSGKVVTQQDFNDGVAGTPRSSAPNQPTLDNPYQPSLREAFIKGLNHIDRDGDNPVLGIITEPLKSTARLLRPDKYFNGVRNDSEVGGAAMSLGMDALNAATIFDGIRGRISAGGEDRLPGISRPRELVEKVRDRAYNKDIIGRQLKPGEQAIRDGNTVRDIQNGLIDHYYLPKEGEYSNTKLPELSSRNTYNDLQDYIDQAMQQKLPEGQSQLLLNHINYHPNLTQGQETKLISRVARMPFNRTTLQNIPTKGPKLSK